MILKAGLSAYVGVTVGRQVARAIGEKLATRADGLEGVFVGVVGATNAYNTWVADNTWFEPAVKIATGAVAWWALGKFTPL